MQKNQLTRLVMVLGALGLAASAVHAQDKVKIRKRREKNVKSLH